MDATAPRRQDRSSARSRATFDKMTSAVFLDYKGMTVETVTKLRDAVPQGGRRVQGRQEHARQAGAQGHAVRRRSSTTSSSGMTGIAWSYEDPAAAAKVVKAFKQGRGEREAQGQGGPHRRRRSSTRKAVENQLATMPGKDELRAMLLATLQAPLQQFVMLLNAPAAELRLRARRQRAAGDEG